MRRLAASSLILRWPALLGLAILTCVMSAPPVARAACGNRVVEEGETCDDGNRFGGDGCASNCTIETVRDFVIDPERSMAVTQLPFVAIPFSVEGFFRVITGQPGTDGIIPFVLRKRDLTIFSVAVPGVVCACPTSEVRATLFGPGNVAAGWVNCAPNPLATSMPIPALGIFVQDHNVSDLDPECTRLGAPERPGDRHPGVCNGLPTGGASEEKLAERGHAALVVDLKIRLIQDGGTCSIDPTDPMKGPDGIPCSEDDPIARPRVDIAVIASTTTLRSGVFDVNNEPGTSIEFGKQCVGAPCQVQVTGDPFDCDMLSSPTGGADTGTMVLAFPVLDAEPVGDSVVTVKLAPVAGAVLPTFTPSSTNTPTVTPTPSVTPTATSTAVVISTATPAHTSTPTLTRPPPCPGDCSADRIVDVAELIRGVQIAVGSAPLESCPAFDLDRDDRLTVDELVIALDRARSGCGE